MADLSNTVSATPTDLIVCVTCRRGVAEAPEGEPRPGRVLYDALVASGAPEGVRLVEANCLQNCDKGCTVALRGGQRWTYIFGNVDEAIHKDMLLNGAAQYHAASDGIIPWRERPDHFKRNCIARIPPLEGSDIVHD
ncbi:MAG: DUF1636 domain-containing protein [Pseudomonadota bacterium]